MGRLWATAIFVLMLAVLVPIILALSPLAWTLRAAKAGLRTIKSSYAFDDGPGSYVETHSP